MFVSQARQAQPILKNPPNYQAEKKTRREDFPHRQSLTRSLPHISTEAHRREVKHVPSEGKHAKSLQERVLKPKRPIPSFRTLKLLIRSVHMCRMCRCKKWCRGRQHSRSTSLTPRADTKCVRCVMLKTAMCPPKKSRHLHSFLPLRCQRRLRRFRNGSVHW